MDRIDTHLGELLIVRDEDGNLRSTDWADYETRLATLTELHYGKKDSHSSRAASQRRTEASRLTLLAIDAIANLAGCQTCRHPFQSEVWGKACGEVPVARQFSYATLAGRNRPAKCRRAVAWPRFPSVAHL